MKLVSCSWTVEREIFVRNKREPYEILYNISRLWKVGNLNIFLLFIIYLFLYLYKVVCSDEKICSVTFVTIKIANINTLKNVPEHNFKDTVFRYWFYLYSLVWVWVNDRLVRVSIAL